MKETIGSFIARRRKELNLTQEDMAKKLNINSKSVSKWECDVNVPDTSFIIPLARVLQVTTDELLNRRMNTEEKNNKNVVFKDEIKIQESDIDKEKMDNRDIKKISKHKLRILLVLLLMVLIFSVYKLYDYFVPKVYFIETSLDTIFAQNGYLILKQNKLYFNLRGITYDNSKTPYSMELYYLDSDNKENTIYMEKNSIIGEINLFDEKGYNNFFDVDNINKQIRNMYLRITYDDKTSDMVRISFIGMKENYEFEMYKNNYFSTEESINLVNTMIEKFTPNDDGYLKIIDYNGKTVEVTYLDNNLFIYEYNDKEKILMKYHFPTSYFSYQKIRDNEVKDTVYGSLSDGNYKKLPEDILNEFNEIINISIS